MVGDILLIICGSLCLIAAIYFAIRPYLPSSLFAYGAMWLFNWSYVIGLPTSFFLSWGIITAVTIGIETLSGDRKWQQKEAAIYMILGAFMGMLIGLSLDEYWLIPGCALGTFLSTLAFRRTPKGCFLKLSNSTLFQYFCFYGLRIVVTVSMIGYILGSIIYRYLAANTSHIL